MTYQTEGWDSAIRCIGFSRRATARGAANAAQRLILQGADRVYIYHNGDLAANYDNHHWQRTPDPAIERALQEGGTTSHE